MTVAAAVRSVAGSAPEGAGHVPVSATQGAGHVRLRDFSLQRASPAPRLARGERPVMSVK